MSNKLFSNVEDFVLDDSFVAFTLGVEPEPNPFWQNFVANNPHGAENFNIARKIVLSVKVTGFRDLPDENIEHIIKNVQSRYRSNDEVKYAFKTTTLSIVLKYAAVLFLFLTAGIGAYYLYNTNLSKKITTDSGYKTVTNRGAESMLIKLSDESSVVLRPKSSLRYPTHFTGNKRFVQLSGDAFFEITKDKAKPFYVYSKNINVRVLGTSFLISENIATGESKVLVSTGRVEVSANKSYVKSHEQEKPLFLTANEEVIILKRDVPLIKTKIKVPLPLSMEATVKSLNFSAAPFSTVVKELEKAYNISIIYDQKIMGNCLLTASLVDQPLDERLGLICKAVEATYRYQDGKVMIDGKGCNN